jgi:lipoate-protein ligase B
MQFLTTWTRGLVPYRDGLRLQERLVQARAAGRIGDTLVLLEHPPVLTVGRGAAGGGIIAPEATLARLGLDVVPVSRGGDVTWHGPGQLVGYPICDLASQGRDLHRFLRGLETALRHTLKRWGVESHRIAGRTGVWVGERKIASIGIAVRGWVSYHGFALNVDPDLSHFDLIHPCGLRGVRMTSLAGLLAGPCPTLAEVGAVAAEELARVLGYEGVVSGAAAMEQLLADPGRERTSTWASEPASRTADALPGGSR